ncbi:MAG: hypothetical protein GY820_43395 [Gammaproteobacteria bacterium]|nr:hypothetical protein [Gammaproteobacteria bacterium]
MTDRIPFIDYTVSQFRQSLRSPPAVDGAFEGTEQKIIAGSQTGTVIGPDVWGPKLDIFLLQKFTASTASVYLLQAWPVPVPSISKDMLESFGQSAFANLRVNTEILSRVRENRRKMTVICPILLKLGEKV